MEITERRVPGVRVPVTLLSLEGAARFKQTARWEQILCLLTLANSVAEPERNFSALKIREQFCL